MHDRSCGRHLPDPAIVLKELCAADGSRKLSLSRNIKCDTCSGSCTKSGRKYQCETCRGQGVTVSNAPHPPLCPVSLPPKTMADSAEACVKIHGQTSS